jgi:hypothetical protein
MVFGKEGCWLQFYGLKTLTIMVAFFFSYSQVTEGFFSLDKQEKLQENEELELDS